MATVVIMPGGFHPFHAGHLALYQSAQRAFPDAEVYVAATNDTSARPFPFPVKEKLAKLAGVEPGHFVQVKSPFRAEEITAKFDPTQDTLIFVRSEKDSDKPPQAGGVKRDGSASYLQPLLGAEKLEPFSKHAYMAYLPTVEFGPGMTSATQIRTAWPTLNEKRKTALVMSLYPAAQKNPRLAATVVKLLDAAIGTESVAETSLEDRLKKYVRPVVKTTPKIERTTNPAGRTTDHVEWKVTGPMGDVNRFSSKKAAQAHYDSFGKPELDKGIAESVEFMSDAQFYGEILSVLAAVGAGLATGAYLKVKDIVKMYNANQIMRALEGYRVGNISDSERRALTKLIAEFKQAMANRQGEDALAIANRIKSIATDQAGVAEGWDDEDEVDKIVLVKSLKWPELVNKVNSAMKATGWKGRRQDDGSFMFSTRGQLDDEWYIVVIDNRGNNMFTYALGTVEEGEPHIGEQESLPMTEASVSELMMAVREGYGLNESGVAENQGWAATLETVSASFNTANTSGAGAGMTAGYQRRDNQPIDEDYLDERRL